MNEIDSSRAASLHALGGVIFSGFRKIIDSFSDSESNSLLSQTSVSLGPEYERFKVWASELGLLIPGHESLDYRVREAENLRSTIETFLNDLGRYLEEVLEIAPSTTPENDGSDKSNVQPLSRPGSPQDHLRDDNSDESDSVMDPAAYIAILMESISDVIDRLFKLSAKIRDPSTRLASSKAQSYQSVDQDTNVDLMYTFEHYDYDYVASMFHDYYKKSPPAIDKAHVGALSTQVNEAGLWHHKNNCSLCKTRRDVPENGISGQVIKRKMVLQRAVMMTFRTNQVLTLLSF
ncbi:MAG: hypothetical protein Q9160_009228 [Pyrenula sp. 1 TL-2023]